MEGYPMETLWDTMWISNDEAYASEEIQDNRAPHTANHESLATIYFYVVSMVLAKEDVSK